MPVTITAKRDGFRRCNAAHATVTTAYPDGHWTEAQLAILRADPNLVVVVTPAQAEETAQAATPGENPEAAAKPDATTDATPDATPDAKPGGKPDAKPETKKSDGKAGGGK